MQSEQILDLALTRSTAINRRQFNGSLALVGFGLLIPTKVHADQPLHYLSCCRNKDGSYAVAGLSDDGNILFTESLDGRGHDIAVAPDQTTAVVFARRPGRFALVLDLMTGQTKQTISAAPHRHFYGHGFFAPDNSLLYASENAYDADAGVIGIYDVQKGYQRIGEFMTGGIGPHEILLMADGRTIVVANGGILTRPEYGRHKLNLTTMRPSLSYLDRQTGDLIEQVYLPQNFHQLSIRHMSIDKNGAIWFGGQYQGARHEKVALIGTHRLGSDPQMIDASADMIGTFRNYVGSVATNRDGSLVATTSPRGGNLVLWDVDRKSIISKRSLTDVCGVAAGYRENDFFLSTGDGRLGQDNDTDFTQTNFSWDNHLCNAM